MSFYINTLKYEIAINKFVCLQTPMKIRRPELANWRSITYDLLKTSNYLHMNSNFVRPVVIDEPLA